MRLNACLLSACVTQRVLHSTLASPQMAGPKVRARVLSTLPLFLGLDEAAGSMRRRALLLQFCNVVIDHHGHKKATDLGLYTVH